MIVEVEWMDGEVRRYESAEKALVGSDRVLRIYSYPVGGRAELIAELPIDHVREWRGGRR